MSPRTVASYRDAFMLFLDFAQAPAAQAAHRDAAADITPALILAFLDHLEHERGNAVQDAATCGWRRCARS